MTTLREPQRLRKVFWGLLVVAVLSWGKVISGAQGPTAGEIIQVTREAKAEREAAGVVFRTEQEIQDSEFTPADRARAVEVAVLVARELERRYPSNGIGLEFYDGASGIVPVGGVQPISFDIILLTRNGPSVDILRTGVEPQALIDDDPSHIPGWQRDWRSVVSVVPGGGGTDPDPDPTPDPDPDLTEILARITAMEARIDMLLQRPVFVPTDLSSVLLQLEGIRQAVCEEKRVELGIRLLGTARGRVLAGCGQ